MANDAMRELTTLHNSIILFLDIDFVLNSHKFELQRRASKSTFTPYLDEIDPRCLKVLKVLLAKYPNLMIVISSDWRKELDLKKFRTIFSHFTFDSNRIIGVTRSSAPKAQSIRLWLKKNKKVKQYLILDDDGLFEMNDKEYPFFYRVPTRGLLSSDLPHICKILEKK